MVKVDVIIIGSGLTGLVTARRLQAAGFVVAVLEAQNAVGGRIRAASEEAASDTEVLEQGVQWIHPEHQRMRALIQELGRTTCPVALEGVSTVSVAKRTRNTRGLLSYWGAFPHEVTDAHLALRILNRRAEFVHLQEPWKSVDAHKFDGESFGDWITRNTRTRWSRDFLRVLFEVALGADVDTVSALHVIFLVASAGSAERFLDAILGHKREVVDCGMPALVDDLAWEMRERVLLNERVVLIENSAHDVGVRTERSRYRAKRVVVALPPAAWGTIVFDPALPEDWDVVGNGSVEGASWRCVVRYEVPFWRRAGHSGEVVSSQGALSFVTDGSSPDGAAGVLVAVAAGPRAHALRKLSDEERRARVLQELQGFFGDEALHPLSFVEEDWTGGERSSGGHASLMAAHAWRRHGEALRTRWGRVHFASAEAASSWAGFLEGAVCSAEEVSSLIASIETPAGTVVSFDE